jgi:hypothetical protein
MAKVSIGLRGWRFDEEAVFTDEGEFKPLAEMAPDVRERVRRLAALVAEPCHACWLLHGEENLSECNVGDVVYGEPLAEVLLCAHHEPDFTYWYREAGGSAYRGEDALRDAFYDWFEAGNRAPEPYGGEKHVDTDPENVPEPVVTGASCDVHLPETASDTGDATSETEESTSETGGQTEDGSGDDADESAGEDPTVAEPFEDDLAREYPS